MFFSQSGGYAINLCTQLSMSNDSGSEIPSSNTSTSHTFASNTPPPSRHSLVPSASVNRVCESNAGHLTDNSTNASAIEDTEDRGITRKRCSRLWKDRWLSNHSQDSDESQQNPSPQRPVGGRLSNVMRKKITLLSILASQSSKEASAACDDDPLKDTSNLKPSYCDVVVDFH